MALVLALASQAAPLAPADHAILSPGGANALLQAAVNDGYTAMFSKGCTGKNELGSSKPANGLDDCAALCDTESACVSFEFGISGTANGKCQLSSTCLLADAVDNNGDWNLYIKKAPFYAPKPKTVCSGRNELGKFYPKGGLSTCADLCDLDPSCVSFEYSASGATKGKCQLSTSCDLANSKAVTSDWTLYVKYTQKYVNYSVHPDKGCSGKNELGTSHPSGGPRECAEMCNEKSSCVSFEYAYDGTHDGKCQLSTSCVESNAKSISGSWNLYVKLPPSPPPPRPPTSPRPSPPPTPPSLPYINGCGVGCNFNHAAHNTVKDTHFTCWERIHHRAHRKHGGDLVESCKTVAAHYPDPCKSCDPDFVGGPGGE